MSKFKDFIIARKVAKFKKAQVDQKVPDQGAYVSLYNNLYKVLTKADSKICILEDSKANKFAMSKEKLAKLLSKSQDGELEKADGYYGQKPRTLVREIGENAKPSSSPSSPKAAEAPTPRAVDPVGTIRNGRKKVVSKKTGKTMWVDITSGEAHESHDKPSEKQPSKEIDQQSKEFFDSLKDELHPADKMKLQRQFKELLAQKQKMTNMLALAHQDVRTKDPTSKQSRDKFFQAQEFYNAAFSKFKEQVKASAKKRKKEGL
jgi:hypothetical protein